MRFGEPLLARFQRHYDYLRSLPRRTRRRLKRRLAMSLATAALLLALSGAPAQLTVNASTVTGDTQIVEVRKGGRGGDFGRFSERPQEEMGQTAVGNPVSSSPAVQSKSPAATIVVNGNNPGTDCTLDDAIIAANTNTATGNCIAGTGDDILDIQVDINLTAPAPTISSTMTLEGNDNTIAGNDTFGPLLTVSATGEMNLNDATVSHGNSANYGGGVLITDGSVTINNSTLSYNYALYGGGGLSNKSGTVVITNSQVISNSSNIHGGGIENSTGIALISDSTIIENYAPYGGGIRNEYAGLMTFVDSTISGNRAIGGAGINNSGLHSNMEIENSTVSDNAATVYSGGIDNVAGATLVVNNSTFSNNSNKGNYGGGIYSGFNAPTTLTITDSTITGNS
jgi:hypothetical protein